MAVTKSLASGLASALDNMNSTVNSEQLQNASVTIDQASGRVMVGGIDNTAVENMAFTLDTQAAQSEVVDNTAVEAQIDKVQDATQEAAQETEAESEAQDVAEPEEVEAEDEAEEEEPDAPAQEAPKRHAGRANKRIQELINERNELRDHAKDMEVRYAQLTAEATQRMADMERGFAQRFQEFEASLTRRSEDANLTEAQRERRKFTDDLASEAEKRVAAKYGEEIKALRQNQEQQQAHWQKLRESAEQKVRLSNIKRQADEVLDRDLLKGYDEKTKAELRPILEEVFHSHNAAYQMMPKDAAPVFKKFLDLVRKAQLSSRADAGKKVAASRKMAPVVPASRAGAGAVAREAATPTSRELAANGFENHIQWNLAGRPQLRKK